MNLFEKATKDHYRFYTHLGSQPVETLWDFSLEQLNNIAIGINKKLKECEEESFIDQKVSSNALVQDHLDIVKHIIKYKLNEKAVREGAKEISERKQYLNQLIHDKNHEKDKGKSLEELQKELDSL